MPLIASSSFPFPWPCSVHGFWDILQHQGPQFKSGSFQHSAAAPQDLLFSPLQSTSSSRKPSPLTVPLSEIHLQTQAGHGRTLEPGPSPCRDMSPSQKIPPAAGMEGRHAHTTAHQRPHISLSRDEYRHRQRGPAPNHVGTAPPQCRAGNTDTLLMLRLDTGRHTKCHFTHQLMGEDGEERRKQ